MEQMLIVHISTLALIIILSMVILINSIKTKNKTVMYLTIATIVISLGSLTYFLINHFKKEHKKKTHVSVPRNVTSIPINEYISSITVIEGMLDKFAQQLTTRIDDYGITQEEASKMSSCLRKQSVRHDLTDKLIHDEDINVLEDIPPLMEKLTSGNSPTDSEFQLYLKILDGISFVMKTDCNPEAIQTLLKITTPKEK
jgi:hypothetical protein